MGLWGIRWPNGREKSTESGSRVGDTEFRFSGFGLVWLVSDLTLLRLLVVVRGDISLFAVSRSV